MGDLKYDLWGSDLYKINNKGIGYVIIRRTQPSGIIIEEPSIKVMEEKKFMLIHSFGGTGFIIKKFRQPFIVEKRNYYALGIVLTAAHTIYSVLKFKSHPGKIDCGFSKGDMGMMQLIPLKCYYKDWKDELYASNGNPYCLPGDIALCLLVANTSSIDLEELPLSACFEESDCSIVGFPGTNIENPISIFPYLGDDKKIAQEKILDIFHEDRALIESKGKVLSNKNLLEISCSGINGMSGSPVVVQGCAVGVFVGGPPLEGQRELLKAATMIKNKTEVEEIWSILISLAKKDEFYKKPIFKNLINDDYVREHITALLLVKNWEVPDDLKPNQSSLPKGMAGIKKKMHRFKKGCLRLIMKTINECLSLYKNCNEFRYNVAIPVSHALFNKIVSSLDGFDLIDYKSITLDMIFKFFNT